MALSHEEFLNSKINSEKSNQAYLIPRSMICDGEIDPKSYVYSFSKLKNDKNIILIYDIEYNIDSISNEYTPHITFNQCIYGVSHYHQPAKLVNELSISGDRYVVILRTPNMHVKYKVLGSEYGLQINHIFIEDDDSKMRIELTSGDIKSNYYYCYIEESTLNKMRLHI